MVEFSSSCFIYGEKIESQDTVLEWRDERFEENQFFFGKIRCCGQLLSRHPSSVSCNSRNQVFNWIW